VRTLVAGAFDTQLDERLARQPFGMTVSDLDSDTRTSDLLLSKVPQVAAVFWLIKVLSTTIGETGADFVNDTLGFGLQATTLVAVLLLAAALVAQFRSRRYIPAVYWTAVVLISVVGTLLTDNLTDAIGVPLEVSTAVFAVLLAGTFVAWWWKERTLSIHSIITRRREAFYWVAILFTFALGTAAGDLVSESIGLGYLVSGLIFAAGIAVTALAFVVRRSWAVPCFWIAYVLTRPLGASFADLVSQSPSHGGLGLGTMMTSAVFLLVIIVLVGLLTVRLRAERRTVEASVTT